MQNEAHTLHSFALYRRIYQHGKLTPAVKKKLSSILFYFDITKEFIWNKIYPRRTQNKFAISCHMLKRYRSPRFRWFLGNLTKHTLKWIYVTFVWFPFVTMCPENLKGKKRNFQYQDKYLKTLRLHEKSCSYCS